MPVLHGINVWNSSKSLSSRDFRCNQLDLFFPVESVIYIDAWVFCMRDSFNVPPSEFQR